MASRNGHKGRRGKDMPLVDLRKQLVGETSHSVAGVAWRWRNEIVGVLIGLILFGHLVERLGGAWAWGVVVLVLVVVVAVPWLRRFAVGRAWCVITRHRLFAVFGQSRIFNRSGGFPLILRIARTPVGEKAVVWCRPGICAEDLEARTEEIRAACWARDARVTRNERFSQLATVEIVRRDPLAAGKTIRSPLVRQMSKTNHVMEVINDG